MSEYFFDTYAIIEVIKRSESYKSFKDYSIITNMLNLTETCYYICENFGPEKVEEIISTLNLSIISMTKSTAIQASKFRFENKKLRLSYADCIGYFCAEENGLKFLTGDDGFKNFNNVEFVK